MDLRAWIVLGLLSLYPSGALAYRGYMERLPAHAGCVTCHDNIHGGEGCAPGTAPCLNVFGQRFLDNGLTFEGLEDFDDDNDDCTAAQELGLGPDVPDDFCARSPGLIGASIPASECARSEEFCCPEVERERLPCECGETSPGEPMCAPEEPELPPIVPTHLPNDRSGSPAVLMDGRWAPFDVSTATSTEPPSSCGSGAFDVWFEYVRDCPSGRVQLELDLSVPATTLTVYDVSDPTRPRSPRTDNELVCLPRASDVTIDGTSLLIRVSGGVGALRATCDATPSAQGSTCGTAQPLAGGATVFSTITGYSSRGPLSPQDPCDTELTGERWFEYTADCTGTAQVRLARQCLSSFCFEAPSSLRLSTYSAHDCSEAPFLTCEASDPFNPGDVATTRVPVRLGETLLVRAGRLGAGPAFQAELSVECIEDGPSCAAQCVELARCEVDDAGLDCTCLEGYRGDGRRPERGGTGCQLEGCDERCYEHGTCYMGRDFPLCRCDDGYENIGRFCRDINECDPRSTSREAAERCNLRLPNNRCINREGGFACGCRSGWSVDATQEAFTCALICGDGIRGPGEACDDGNLVAGDGCDGLCEVEWNFRCFDFGGPSVCENTCGDGWIDENEDPDCESGDMSEDDNAPPQIELPEELPPFPLPEPLPLPLPVPDCHAGSVGGTEQGRAWVMLGACGLAWLVRRRARGGQKPSGQ